MTPTVCRAEFSTAKIDQFKILGFERSFLTVRNGLRR